MRDPASPSSIPQRLIQSGRIVTAGCVNRGHGTTLRAVRPDDQGALRATAMQTQDRNTSGCRICSLCADYFDRP